MKTIDAKKLHAFGVEFLKAYGASQENAVIITDHLVDNDLKGIEAHGAMRLFEYAKFMVDGKLDGTAQPVVTEKAPGAFLVDGNPGLWHRGPEAGHGEADRDPGDPAHGSGRDQGRGPHRAHRRLLRGHGCPWLLWLRLRRRRP